MDQISFQNGFLCGMATRGLTKSGEFYKPHCYNDNGNYSYFYLDFKRELSDFSSSMFIDSISVMGLTSLPITGIQRISSGLYKVFCNLTDCIYGVIVMNQPTTLLSFGNGEKVPSFSTHFMVAGLASYLKLEYAYDRVQFYKKPMTTYENAGVILT